MSGFRFLRPLTPALVADWQQRRALRRLVRAHSFPLTWTGAEPGGAGWELLEPLVQASAFVLLGEEHGLAEAPPFAAALARAQQPALFVAEIDPYQAQDLTQLTGQPEPPTAFLQAHPGALGFYSWVEEFELVRALRAQGVQLRGIDQVFVAAVGRWYARLAELVTQPEFGAYLRQCAAQYQAQDRAALLDNSGRFSLLTQTPAELARLHAGAAQEGPAVQRMVADYAASYAINQAQLQGTGGHQQRINLLKRNLWAQLPAAGASWPRMLFKFGSVHLARNASPGLPGTFYDLGSLLPHLADVQEQTSLHVLIVGRQGRKAGSIGPVGSTRPDVSYRVADSALRELLGVPAGGAWRVLDLRPLRRALVAGELRLDELELHRTVLGYDCLVVIPDTTPSRLYC